MLDFKTVFYVLLIFFCSFAANLSVRDGCTGDGTGGWGATDACDQISTAIASAARGDTIWLADGSYTGFTFNVAASGTDKIVIKKATAASHGEPTGWSDSYGDGIPVITSGLTISAPYLFIDGLYNDTCGIHIVAADDYVYTYYVRVNAGGGNFIMQYCDIGPEVRSWPGCDCIGYSVLGADSCTFAHNYFHHMGDLAFTIKDHEGWLFEYNHFYKCDRHGDKRGYCGNDGQLNHGVYLELYNGTNITIRYNTFVNMVGSGAIGFYDDSLLQANIYGNIFYHENDFYRTYTANSETDVFTSVDTFDLVINTVNIDDGIVFYDLGTATGISVNTPYHTINKSGPNFQLSLTAGGDPIDITASGTLKRYEYFGSPGLFGNTSGAGGIKNCKIYNNTITNFPFSNYWTLYGFTVTHDSGGNEYKNNLIYSQFADPSYTGITTRDYNASNKAMADDAHLQTLASNPFTDTAIYDFTPVANTTAGTNLGAPYNYDMLGVLRSSWTRGAYEFGGTPAVNRIIKVEIK